MVVNFIGFVRKDLTSVIHKLDLGLGEGPSSDQQEFARVEITP